MDQPENDRRFIAAVFAMQALLTGRAPTMGYEAGKDIIEHSVVFADALLAELDKPK